MNGFVLHRTNLASGAQINNLTINGDLYWLGLERNGTFSVWIDGSNSTYKPISSGGLKDCYVYSKTSFIDTECEKKYSYTCKKAGGSSFMHS